ncbi:MAG: M28 family peptidase, partial [bacterium]|nr:M28 family peptidase [bacterium]
EIIGRDTQGRFDLIDQETRALGLSPKRYELASPRGVDRSLTVQFDYGRNHELWLTANYDKFNKLPAANNNASGVVALLGLSEYLRDISLPVNMRIVYFDAGLDTDLIARKKRNADFVPGSGVFLRHMMDEEIDFIDSYTGAIVVQAVGKGNLSVFERTGRKNENSRDLNGKIVNYGKSVRMPIEVKDQSPNADNISFLKEGLPATVLARYHEGAWHKMQTPSDDMTNVSSQTVDETINFILGVLKNG